MKPQHQQHTIEESFAGGVARGRKEVLDGDYHNLAISFLFLFLIFVISALAARALLRWLIHW